MSVVGGSCVKVGRGGSDGSSAGSSVVGGSSAAVGDGGSGNSSSSSVMASFKVEGLGPQSSSEVQGVEGRGSDSEVEGRGSDDEVEGLGSDSAVEGRGSESSSSGSCPSPRSLMKSSNTNVAIFSPEG